ncbi:MAG: tRNA (adenosine(37)-N6)-threonylcarbamoyltransferase complex ATPase subunit type 1 TsaE, partial [Phycisphaerales bacterium]|nr:tRNA (adenosine(37)-N6)-threonylcarbamoyltransferase complex ATPase subunit type 1 TsaE [Phycisphaerales bacterium]
TCFSRGFVATLAPEVADWVASPTYALCNTYPGETTIHHLDLYRITSLDDLESVGFWDLLDDTVVLVEWSDRVPEVRDALDVIVTIGPGATRDARAIGIEGLSTRGRRIVEALRSS